jgi:hypothetical protein
MANNQSWEFYQQSDTNVKYPLQWIAGAANPGSLTTRNVGRASYT